MNIRTGCELYLHKHRKNEFNLIFKRFPKKCFNKGLEVGAGDGYQTTLLVNYVKNLISSDYNLNETSKNMSKSVKYIRCDAEILEKYFNKSDFDIVFSSNLMEHLKKPGRFLGGIKQILKDDGITIHVMPSPFWKLNQLFFHHANLMLFCLKKIKLKKSKNKYLILKNTKDIKNNNSKSKTFYVSLKNAIWPQPHGEYDSNIKELFMFRKSIWLKEFQKAGFENVAVLKGPVYTCYGFGLNSVRTLLEQMGFCSTYIFVATKKKKESPYTKYFKDR